MSEDELDELVADCPRLFHMAERGALPGIRRHGLLSTSALLDLYGVEGAAREAIERRHRPGIVELADAGLGRAMVRDQIPMSDAGLRKALPASITPADWYARLNAMVFFWLSEARLERLTGARAYRDTEHEILVLDTAGLLAALRERVWLCPINSGCTKPMAHPRDFGTFRRIPDYDYARWRARRGRGERVVELCVDRAVPEVGRFLLDAYVVRGDRRLGPVEG